MPCTDVTVFHAHVKNVKRKTGKFCDRDVILVFREDYSGKHVIS